MPQSSDIANDASWIRVSSFTEKAPWCPAKDHQFQRFERAGCRPVHEVDRRCSLEEVRSVLVAGAPIMFSESCDVKGPPNAKEAARQPWSLCVVQDHAYGRGGVLDIIGRYADMPYDVA